MYMRRRLSSHVMRLHATVYYCSLLAVFHNQYNQASVHTLSVPFLQNSMRAIIHDANRVFVGLQC